MDYIGYEVIHKKFGKGIVIKQNEKDLCINFYDYGQKNILYSNNCNEQYIEIYDPRCSLLTLLKKFGFDGFHHYTNSSNLISIFNEEFLYSRELAEQKNIFFWNGAENRIVEKTRKGITDHVRFYYKESTPTLYQNEGIKSIGFIEHDSYSAHMPIPVLLLFDENLLFEKNVKISSGGCGNSFSKVTGDFDCAMHFDWQEIFSRNSLWNNDIFYEYEKRKKINKRNAEFLVPNKVSLKYLKAIIFRSEADKKYADFILGTNHIYQNSKKDINEKKFSVSNGNIKGKNYLKNYIVKTTSTEYRVFLYFDSDASNYSHKLKIYRKNNFCDEYTLNEYIENNVIRFSIINSKDILQIEYIMNNNVCAIWR